MESLPERKEATGTPTGDTDPGSSHFWEVLLPRGHWCRQMPFWNPPSGSLASGPSPAHPHQPVDTSTTGMPQAKHLAGEGGGDTAPPTNKQAETAATLGHGPIHQRAQDSASHTIAQALDLGLSGPCSQRRQDTHPPTTGQAPAPGYLALPNSKPVLALGPASPTSSRQTPAPGQPQTHSLLTQPTYQQTSTSPRTR